MTTKWVSFVFVGSVLVAMFSLGGCSTETEASSPSTPMSDAEANLDDDGDDADASGSLTGSVDGSQDPTQPAPPSVDGSEVDASPIGDILPGTNGCACERAPLAAGRYPTRNSVGHCGATPKTRSGRLVIDARFLQSANGGSKVVDGLDVAGDIQVVEPGVTLCNFKAYAVKIMAADVRVQDGTLVPPESSHTSIFVNFAPSSSGLATRIYAEGGEGDGVRVSPTAAGRTMAVTESYFTNIAVYRTPDAHADLVQTYPVIELGMYHSSLVERNYFASASYNGGIAVNATWMAMGNGARFKNNIVDRVNQGFWHHLPETSKIEVTGNSFNRDQVNGVRGLSCSAQPNVTKSNNIWFRWQGGQIIKVGDAPTCN